MKPTTLQQKAAALLHLDQRRKAHHRALSMLHASPVNPEKTWQCKSGHITKSIHKPDVCRKCKEEITDLWLSSFREVPPTQEEHEKRGLSMWRRLRRLEQLAHRGAEAYCNGERLNLRPGTSFDFRGDEDAWMQFCECVKGEAMKVFGGIAPPGFYVNGDPRGYALKLDPDKTTVPAGMETDWGGYGILAADITM